MSYPNMVTNDYSQTIGTTAVQVLTRQTSTTPTPGLAAVGHGACFYRIFNAAAVGGGNLWLSRVLGGVAAPNAAGSYMLAPGATEEFRSPVPVPLNGLSIVSTSAGTPVTIEIGYYGH